MNKSNVYDMPLTFNICDQMLREVDRIPEWSMAHVVMNPLAYSLLHEHHKMHEIYVITRGSGNLVSGESVYSVQTGDVALIPPYMRHKLTNTSLGSLEHLVFAMPPFQSDDVYIDEQWKDPEARVRPFVRPLPTDCFDGAKIVAYPSEQNPSVAFGWVTSDPTRHKPAHYHRKTTEWIYVAEGNGAIEINDTPHDIRSGDWIRVDPLETHALRNNDDRAMVVVCACTPRFSMNDVYYK